MKNLQVCQSDRGAGAERITRSLHDAYRERGHESRLVVGLKHDRDPNIELLPNHAFLNPWSRSWWLVHLWLWKMNHKVRGAWRLSRLARALGDPKSLVDQWRGVEDYRFPATWRILEIFRPKPDLLHLHGLHGGYFDLRALPHLSGQLPVFWTLHDEWAITGYCYYSVDCRRWETGCGMCPRLLTVPSIIPDFLRHDATAENWKQKRDLYRASRLYVASPSDWLLKRARRSILNAGIAGARVIPNGVDTRVFEPGDRLSARRQLGIPENAAVVLAVAASIRGNALKGYPLMREIMERVASRITSDPVVFVALGASSAVERCGALEVRFASFQRDRHAVARYYQSADLYLHGAESDNFPNTVLEALACGVPVVARASGGVPEQVRGLIPEGGDTRLHAYSLNQFDVSRATGILIPGPDVTILAQAVEYLLRNKDVRNMLAANARADALDRFTLERQADLYLEWYDDVLREWSSGTLSKHV